ncbi:MAG TPA: caspase family protein [Syntrophales bacterium]|nr:caspase family protein [Syntrophales bacterium]
MRKTSRIMLIIFVLIFFLGCGGRTKWVVAVKTYPPEASVYGDDKFICKTPCDIMFDRDPILSVSKKIYSPNRITIKKDGYKEINRIYTTAWDVASEIGLVRANISQILSFNLEPLPSSTADNSYIGQKAPLSFTPKPPSDALLNIQGQRWAVVIGISNYKDSRIVPLRYASKDGKSFYDWLISASGGKYPPSNVRLIINEEATGQNIKDALFNWLGKALAEDLVIIYFAGHGSPQSPDQPNNLFLLPYDTQYDNVAASGFPMWDIETAFKRFIKAKKVVVIADACHSGGVGQSFDIARRGDRSIEINPISASFQNLSQIGDGIAVISASDEKQFSQEGIEWGGGHGVFTYFLLKGLQGDADYNKQGRVTLGELIPYLSEKVRRETRNAQSPTVAGKFDPALSIGR